MEKQKADMIQDVVCAFRGIEANLLLRQQMFEGEQSPNTAREIFTLAFEEYTKNNSPEKYTDLRCLPKG